MPTYELHTELSKAANSVTAGVFASCLKHHTIAHGDTDGWVCRTQKDWKQDTAMSRREQETARRCLRDAGLLEEAKRGIPCRICYRLTPKALRLIAVSDRDIA